MTAVGNPINAGASIARVQNILMKPAPEWEVIEGEAGERVQSLFMGYACVLALIPAVASIIGGLGSGCSSTASSGWWAR